MPEGYTHIRTARAAARLANIEPADRAAFDCGANGPDMLFCYRVWRKSARRGIFPPPGRLLKNGRSVSYYTIFVKVIARFSPVFFLRNFAFLRPGPF